MERVLGGIEQHATGIGHDEAPAGEGMPAATATARSRARKDLPHFGSPPMMPTACSDHNPSAEPAPLFGALGETPGRLNRKLGHRRRRIAALVSFAVGTAQISKNSVSSIWRASRCAAAARSSSAMIIRARGLPWA